MSFFTPNRIESFTQTCKTVIVTVAMLTIPVMAVAHGPTPQKTELSITIKADKPKVWEALTKFDSWKWQKDLVIKETKVVEEKQVRTGTLAGNPVTETLKMVNVEDSKIKYAQEEGGIKVNDLAHTITVKSEADGSTTVTWMSRYYREFMQNSPPEGQDDKAAKEKVDAFVQKSLDELKASLEQPAK